MSGIKRQPVERASIGAIPITLRLPPQIIEPLDAFISAEADAPLRAEAIRRILRDWLTGKGYLTQSE